MFYRTRGTHWPRARCRPDWAWGTRGKNSPKSQPPRGLQRRRGAAPRPVRATRGEQCPRFRVAVPTLRDLRDSEQVSRIGGPGRDSAYCGNRDQLQNSTLLGGHVEGGSQPFQAASAGDTGIRVCSAAPAPGRRDQQDRWAWGAPRKPQADAGGVGFLVKPKDNSPPEVRRTLPSKQSLGQNKQRHTWGHRVPSWGKRGSRFAWVLGSPAV